MNRLEGKHCVVTGAASGIGWATCVMFDQEGATVHAVDVDSDRLEKLLRTTPSANPYQIDITSTQAINNLSAQIDVVDVLFNCAGCVPVGNILQSTEKDWRFALDLNVGSIFMLTQALLPKMLAQNNGSIINMASVISSIGGAPDRFVYGATKGAVIGMTKSIAKDFADQGIRCNAICPSAVETPTMRERIDAMDDPQSARQQFSQRQPVGRMGTPEEIASLAVYLASDESKFVTGSAIVIDGGAKI